MAIPPGIGGRGVSRSYPRLPAFCAILLLGIPWVAINAPAAPAPSDRITISSDVQFTSGNGVVGGSGTPTDPYLIENLTFDLGAGGSMRISDTSAHFVIRNVSFVNGTGDEEALGLDGVRNGRIEQVRIEGARSGISSRSVGFGARDLVIDSVSIRDTRMGIEIQAPMNVSVLNSTFTNSSYEFLRLAYGGSAAVVGNHFANSVRSISLWELDALEFQSNVVDNVSRLELEDIGSGNVSSNHFNLSTNMYVQRSRGLNLTGNQFQGFPRAELSLEFSTGLRLASNTFDVGGIRILGQGREHFSTHNISSDNSVGAEPIVYRASCGNETHDADDFGQLFLVDCSYVRVQPGTVRDSAVAVTVAYSRDVRIAGLTALNVTDGVMVQASTIVWVENSTINASRAGVESGSTVETVMNNNTIFAIQSAVSLWSTSDAFVSRNQLSGRSGVSIWDSVGTKFHNNLLDGAVQSSFVNVSGAFISSNEWTGGPGEVRVEDSNNVKFVGNVLQGLGSTFVRTNRLSVDGNWIAPPNESSRPPYAPATPPVSLWYTKGAFVDNNTLVHGGIRLLGLERSDYDSHTIGGNNTAGGAPILYRPNCTGESMLGASYGQAIFAACNDVFVANATLAADGGGLTLAYVDGVVVQNSSIDAADVGLFGQNISNASIHHNTIGGFAWAAVLRWATHVDVEANRLEARGKTWVPPPFYDTGPIGSYAITPQGGGLQLWGSGPTTVVGNEVPSGGAAGIEVAYGSGPVSVYGNSVNRTTSAGISIRYASSVSVAGNDVEEINGTGIDVIQSPNVTIRGNDIDWCGGNGIGVASSPGAEVFLNYVRYNGVGIQVNSTDGATFYRNAVGNNTLQADSHQSSVNWSGNYTVGGNLWSDYSGNDTMSGPDQDQPGSDGYGDTPYISANATDPYPRFVMLTTYRPGPAPPRVSSPPVRTLAIAHVPPQGTVSGPSLSLSATVTGAVGDASVALFWRMNGSDSWAEERLPEGAGGVYAALIDLPAADGEVEYYLTAQDFRGSSVRSPLSGSHRVAISNAPPSPPILSHDAPEEAAAGSPLTLEVTPLGTVGQVNVTLYWRTGPSRPWVVQIPLAGPSGNYTATIVLPADATSLEYYFEASDATGYVMRDPPAGAYRLPVTPGPAPGDPPGEPPGTTAPASPPADLAILVAAVAALSAAIIVLGSERGSYRVAGLVFARLFPRLRQETILGHFLRGRLYQVISQNPGVHFSELRRLAEVSSGTASHHLHVLEKNGYVRSESQGALVRFYATPRSLDEQSYTLIEEDRMVLEAVRAAPGISEEELAEKMGQHPASVKRHIENLQRLGYLERPAVRDGAGLFARKARDP